MSSNDSDPFPPKSSIEATPGEAGDLPVGPSRSARLWVLTLIAGVVTGLAAWLGGEVSRNVFRPPLHEVRTRLMTKKVPTRHDEAVADARNAGVAFGLLGAFLGMGMGLAGGWTRRSGRAAASAGLVGLVLGTIAALGLSLVLLPLFWAAKERDPDAASREITLPLLVHVGVWSAIGAAGGLALGIGLGQRDRGRLVRVAVGGLAAAAAGAVAYELVGAVVFPFAATTQPVSTTWETRLLARLAVTVLASAGAALAVGAPGERPASPVA